jgi:ABC-type Na+ efflux pump permease subunit
MLRLRAPDVFFAGLALAIAALLALDMAVIVLALVGAFACGSLYVFAGMIPERTESFGTRVFVSVFLSLVLSSLVLILPGTFGAQRPDMQGPVLTVAALLPVLAFLFEVVRTPRLIEHVLRRLRLR